MTTRLRPSFLATGALLAALTVSLVAAAKLSKTGSATGGFHAAGPAGMNIDGTTSDVRVADDGTTIVVTVGLTSLTTGMSLRDKHTQDALETATFPDAQLSVPRASIKFPTAGVDTSGDTQGSMKIHGQTKNVSFHYSATVGGDGTIGIKGNATITVSDFGIKPPSYLSISIKPDVVVSVNFQAKDN